MAATAQKSDGELAMDINTTPLIDVMLVLLTLLILTLPMQTHALKLDMPRNVPPTNPPPTSVDLRVEFDGRIYWNEKPIERSALHAYIEQSQGQTPQPEIHLLADSLASYDAVADVLGEAQRLGVTKIGFAGIDQFGG
jgi:biopolymer transport protein ExbD